MKRAYAKSKYAKPCERYCREVYPEEAEQIFQKAETYYLEFMKDMPDLGENMMAWRRICWTGSQFSPFMRQAAIGWTAKRCSRSSEGPSKG